MPSLRPFLAVERRIDDVDVLLIPVWISIQGTLQTSVGPTPGHSSMCHPPRRQLAAAAVLGGRRHGGRRIGIGFEGLSANWTAASTPVD
jgi:hypothetical protein